MEGPVDALDGVPGPGYVLAHLKALEKVRARFVRCGWRVDPGRIPVFFKALEPGLEGRTIGEPLGIELSSRHRDAGRPGDRARIEYVAAHELFHVVQAGFRGESLGQGDPWAWFGEATAQFMVGRGSPRNPHRLEWVSSQFDHPERPLDAPGAEDYGAMLFCKFLEDRFRKGRFLQRVWNLARQCKSPFHAVERLASAQGHGKRIPFASATEEDLFCNEFLAWNFFLDKWPAPGGYRQAWELSRRFQHAFTGPLEIGDDSCAGGGKALPPLGARYHLMRLRSGLAKLKVTLSMKSDRASLSPGKGILRLVSADRRPLGAPQQLILKRGRKGNSRFEGEAVLANGKAGRDAYVLLIVANTDWKKRRFIARYDFSCHAIP
jgi:hypothetical protein